MNTAQLLARLQSDWQRVSPSTDAVTMRRCILLRRVAGALGEAIERVQQQHGLNHALTDVLFTLYRSAPPEGLSAGELAALSAITPGSMTHRLDRVVASGLARRTTDITDARTRRICLTAAGRRVVEQLLPLHVQNEQQLLAGLTKTEQQELERLLLKLAEHLENQEA